MRVVPSGQSTWKGQTGEFQPKAELNTLPELKAVIAREDAVPKPKWVLDPAELDISRSPVPSAYM